MLQLSSIIQSSAAKILLDRLKLDWPPAESFKIDFGTDPYRTTKGITLKCTMPTLEVSDQGRGGTTFKFTQRVNIDVYVRDIKAGTRLDTVDKPVNLVKIEKYLMNYLTANRLSFIVNDIQTVETTGSQIYQKIIGEKNMRSLWYHLQIYCSFHYWIRAP